MNNRIDKYFSMKEEFDLEIAHSQVAKIIIELTHKYQLDEYDNAEIKQKLAEIFVILAKAKNNKKINKEENNGN